MKDSQSASLRKKKPKRFIKKKPQNKPIPKPVVKTIFKAEKKHSLGKNLGKFWHDIVLLFIPLGLLFIFIVLMLINLRFQQEIEAAKVPTYIAANKINPYPFVGEIPLLPLTAKAAIIIDADSQVAIFEKNSHLLFPMASTAKLMTSLVALDYYKSNSLLTVQSTGVEGSVLGLVPGEQFYFEDLLYAMLLPSANDAAVAIADNYPGGKDAFVAKMNEKAQTLHLLSTRFSDPTGLDDDHDYTTVIDMSRLASIAMKNKEVATVTGTKQKIITTVDGLKQYSLTNLNKLLGINGVTGMKTGTTNGAGEVLVTSAVKNGHTFVIVVMNSQDRFSDTQVLLNFIDQQVQYIDTTKAAQ